MNLHARWMADVRPGMLAQGFAVGALQAGCLVQARAAESLVPDLLTDGMETS